MADTTAYNTVVYNIIGPDKGFEKCDFCNSQNWVMAPREYPVPLTSSAAVIKFNCSNAEQDSLQPSRHASYLLSAELFKDNLRVVEITTKTEPEFIPKGELYSLYDDVGSILCVCGHKEWVCVDRIEIGALTGEHVFACAYSRHMGLGHPIYRAVPPGSLAKFRYVRYGGPYTMHTVDDLLTYKDDPVSHPTHYTSHPSGVECIDITRHHNFDIGNAIKYLWRNGLKDKDSQIEDLEKAIWYIQDEIKRLKNATTDS